MMLQLAVENVSMYMNFDCPFLVIKGKLLVRDLEIFFIKITAKQLAAKKNSKISILLKS